MSGKPHLPVRRKTTATIALVVAVGMTGCASNSALRHASTTYYTDGPEGALERLEAEPAPARDAALIAMERAVILQELGAYEESNRVLREALDLQGRTAGNPASLLVNDRAAPYRCEPFERVYLHTLAVANHLSLGSTEAAVEAAEDALEAVDDCGCDACRFPFTRYVAALAFEGHGLTNRALESLVEAVAESPSIEFLEREMDRLSADDIPSPGRELVVLLLMGRGPEKVEHGAGVYPGHAIVWPHYVPRPQGAIARAHLEAGGRSLASAVPLTDINELAEASLHSRMGGLVAKETGKTILHEAALRSIGRHHGHDLEFVLRGLLAIADRADVRHWSTLPASCRVLRTSVPPDVESVDLVYTTAAGQPVFTEALPLDPEWTDGTIILTRRAP